MDGDAVVPPKEWAKHMKGAKTITPMLINRAVDVMTGIINDKITADRVDKEQGTEIAGFATFVVRGGVDEGAGHRQRGLRARGSQLAFFAPPPVDLRHGVQVDWFVNKHGTKGYKKQFKSFVARLMRILGDQEHPIYDFALLFAQLCQMQTRSRRVWCPSPPRPASSSSSASMRCAELSRGASSAGRSRRQVLSAGAVGRSRRRCARAAVVRTDAPRPFATHLPSPPSRPSGD